MVTNTVQKVEHNFDDITNQKKSYYIIDEDNEKFAMTSFDDFEYYNQYFIDNNEAP